MAALARRRFRLYITKAIMAEYERVAWELKEEEDLAVDPAGSLGWLSRKAKILEPSRLTRQVCRDPDDDKFLECALAAKADYIVSRDPDLIALGKPYGIEIVTPRRFLSILQKESR